MLGFTCAPTVEQLQAIVKQAPNITTLRFTNTANLDTQALEEFKELKTLVFNNTDIPAEAFQNLPKSIKNLEISAQKWTDDKVTNLLNWLKTSNITELTLGDTGDQRENVFNFQVLPFSLPKNFEKLILINPEASFYKHTEERTVTKNFKTIVFSRKYNNNAFILITVKNPFNRQEAFDHYDFSDIRRTGTESHSCLSFIQAAAQKKGNQNQLVTYSDGRYIRTYTPLSLALKLLGNENFSGINLETIKQLLNNQSDPNFLILDVNIYKTAFHVAIANAHISTEHLHEIIELLLTHGLNLEITHNKTESLFTTALQNRPTDHKLIEQLTQSLNSENAIRSKDTLETLLRKPMTQKAFHKTLDILYKAGFELPAFNNAETMYEGFTWNNEHRTIFNQNLASYQTWLEKLPKPPQASTSSS
jgi:hypothetical protein